MSNRNCAVPIRTLGPALRAPPHPIPLAAVYLWVDGGDEQLQDALEELSMQHVKAMFKQWDHDGNGTLTRTEFAAAMKELGLAVTKTQLHLLFNQMDADNSGRVTYAEIEEYVVAQNEKLILRDENGRVMGT